MPRSSFVFADIPPTLPFHSLLFMHYSKKIPKLHALINSSSQAFVAGYWRIREHPNPLFFFLILFKWNVLTTIDPDFSKKNSVQCFKLIQVILNGLTLPVGHSSRKKAWGNLSFNLAQRSIWSRGWTDSILEVEGHCKLVLFHRNPLSALRWLCYSMTWRWFWNWKDVIFNLNALCNNARFVWETPQFA